MQIDIQILITATLALIAAGIISFITTPIVRLFAQKVGAVDVPKDSRRVHNHPIPRMGGLAIFIGFVLSVVLFASVDNQMRGILLGAVIITVVGVVDDITPLPALLKLVIQIAAALVAVAFGVRIEFLANPIWWSETMYIDLGFLSIPVTVLWIVGLTNAVNLIDGLDGLACGVSAIASIAMMTIALAMGQWNTAIILAALVGACFGFMPFNLNPARIFMGDTGALMLGYVMACISITGLLKFYAIISFIVPLLALGLPIFDTAFAIIRRLAHGQNPMSPDRGHFHHRLIDMGLSQKQAVALLYAISAILGFASVLIATSGEMRAIVLIFAFCVAFAIGLALMRSVYPERFGINSDEESQTPSDPKSEEKGEEDK
ncbi:MAG: undecaprenyl/decaprenyl-phosphate alpha-N-acetylglucosaminyl 1-phosphate transferase [Oscillospiraceae bacterium]|nr:undecaprenyl/decaprenyl-phosphate alpha-N-acetylglucosaminyl 1-phosphate transferase [Oscillospiraceae bacterium]